MADVSRETIPRNINLLRFKALMIAFCTEKPRERPPERREPGAECTVFGAESARQ